MFFWLKFFVYILIGLALNANFFQFCETAAPVSNDLEWPIKPNDSVLIKEQDFKTYIEIRYEGDQIDGEGIYTIYKSSWGEEPVKYMSDEDISSGLQRLYRPVVLNEKVVLVVIEVGMSTFTLISPDKSLEVKIPTGKINSDKIFVFNEFLITNHEFAYNINTIKSEHPISSVVNTIPKLGVEAKTQISKCECEALNINCGQDYDVEDGGIFKFQKGYPIFKRNSKVLYAKCQDTKNEKNYRCHYYLNDTATGKQWFIPQNLKVANSEPAGVRTVLFPVADGSEPFFQGGTLPPAPSRPTTQTPIVTTHSAMPTVKTTPESFAYRPQFAKIASILCALVVYLGRH